MDYQGRYPVIHLNLKNLGQDSFLGLQEMLRSTIAGLYNKNFRYLLQSKYLVQEKELIEKFIAKTASWVEYQEALAFLISCLQIHHKQKVIVLIDEYDTPFHYGIHWRDYAATAQDQNARKQYLEKAQDFFQFFLGSALKDNDQLHKCLMTGVVCIAGAGVLSDLNNMRSYTILDEPFQEAFGFTEKELTELLTQIGKLEQKNEYTKWYNGYRFGNETIYNPWSVMCSLEEKKFKGYWLETSNNNLIRTMLLRPKTVQDALEINSTIAELIAGTEVKKILQSGLIFDNHAETLEHLWILFLSAGYLKAENVEQIPDSNALVCSLAIPNLEVSDLYKTIFSDWLQKQKVVRFFSPLIEYWLLGDAKYFSTELSEIFKKIVSAQDASRPNLEEDSRRYEAFYHGFMIGLLALSLQKQVHNVFLRSNRESGRGYYDLVLEPKEPNNINYYKGVIFEFRRAQNENSLQTEAAGALAQIKTKHYVTDMAEHGVREIICMGMAFYQKTLVACYERYDCQSKRYVALSASVPLQEVRQLQPVLTTKVQKIAEQEGVVIHSPAGSVSDNLSPDSRATENDKVRLKNTQLSDEESDFQPPKKPRTNFNFKK